MYHEIQGGCATAIVYGNYPDKAEVQDLYAMLSVQAFSGAKIRIMPDHHAGKGCMIGFTCPIDMAAPRLIPNIVGVDIGCGVLGICLPKDLVPLDRVEHFAAFDRHLRAEVPFGMRDREQKHPELEEIFNRHVQADGWDRFKSDFDPLIAKVKISPSKAYSSLGSLGSGNHFIEIGEEISASGEVRDSNWLTVHSGSRNFGLQVCLYHQKKAMDTCTGTRKDLSYLEGDDALEYLRDMRVAQQFATLNRWTMVRTLLGAWKMRYHVKVALESVQSVHNFIGDDNVIRKGAISAKAGEKIVIPWNMRDGLILGAGRGNSEWNNSAPHGAGRLMSRGDAKRTLSLSEFKMQMQEAGIWTSCVSKDTLDEAPDAYKSASDVAGEIVDTVEVQASLRTRYNFKATGKKGQELDLGVE